MDQGITTYKQYLNTERGRSSSTIKAYVGDVERFRRFLDSSASGLPLEWREVSARNIRAYLASLENAGPYRVQRIIAALRSWFAYLVGVEKEFAVNPALEIAKPKLPKRLPKYLQTHEVARLLEGALKFSRVAEAERNWAALAFLYGSGLRLSEMLGLTLDRVAYSDGRPVSVRVIGKGDKERIVPLSPTAQRALHQWLKHRKLEGSPSSPFVWVQTRGRSKGKVLTARSVQWIIDRVSKSAGLGPLSPHKLRHSYASALVEAGRSIDEVKDLLGHAGIQTTQIYVHASRARLEAAAASLPDVLDMGI
jgi:integrase/recombinase XerD